MRRAALPVLAMVLGAVSGVRADPVTPYTDPLFAPQCTFHHFVEGEAPPLEGLYGRPVALADGRTVIADERYLRDAILLPAKEVVAGYAPVMPSFSGQIPEGDLLDLIAYLKNLAGRESAPR